MSKQLSPLFSEIMSANIWQTHFSDDNLLVSCRDNEQMEASFSLYSLTRRSFLWRDLVFEEPWWISVCEFVNDIVVFQTFTDAQNIEERSVFGFNINLQEVVWAVDNATVVSINNTELFLKSNETTARFNLNTGEELVEDSEFHQKSMSQEAFFPFHYGKESPYFETVASFLKQFANKSLVGACDYLEYGGMIFIAAHEQLEQNLINTLYAFDKTGVQVFTEVLENRAQGLASSTFYIVNDQLIFVKEKRELKGYLIKSL